MAIFNWYIGSYGKGRATSQSNYIWGRAEFREKDDVVAIGCGNLPDWCNGDPAVLFAAADRFERKNWAACRHLVVTLPRELSLSEWKLLVGRLVAHDLGPKPYQYAIHNPGDDELAHPHAHVVYSDRVPDDLPRDAAMFFRRPNPKVPALGGCKKDSGGQSPKLLRLKVLERKKLWADLQNEALEAGGHAARVDHRSCGSKPIE